MSRNSLPSTHNSLLSDQIGLAAEAFYTAKEAERCSPRTLDAYRLAVGMFTTWLRDHGLNDPAKLTPSLVRAYFADLSKRGFASSTVHDYARPVKTFVRFLYADEMIHIDVMAKVKMPRQEKQILPAFSTEEAQAVFKACNGEREKALCLFLLDTGLRASELCALTIGDFNGKTGSVMVRHGKGGKDRVVFVGARARQAVLRYLMTRKLRHDDDPLFPSDHKGEQLTPNGLLQLCRRIGRRSGVKHCSPHTFRRTFALWSLRAGMDLMRLASLMGHSDVTVLRRYLDLKPEDLQAAHREHGAVDSQF